MIQETDVVEVLLSLTVNKARGPNGISHRMLKETSRTICKPLTILFNRSLSEKIVSLWNNLDIGIRNSPSLNIFKSKIKATFQSERVHLHIPSWRSLPLSGTCENQKRLQ